jgi:glycosyltransferase involved in cell wall biosynthesis
MAHPCVGPPEPYHARPGMSFSVVIVQVCVPHYRRVFFQRLIGTYGGRWKLAAGEVCLDPRLRATAPGPDLQWTLLESWSMGSDAVWLRGLRPMIQSNTLLILEFNPRVINSIWACASSSRIGGLILWGHGMSPRRSSSQFAKRVRLAMANRADALIFYGEEARLEFSRLGVPTKKIFVAPNGLDVETIASLARRNSGLPRANITYIGRLIREKRVDLLVRAYAEALPDLPAETRLVILGDGPEQEALREISVRSGVAHRLDFLGELVHDEEIARVFGATAVSVIPGHVGLGAIHSLAHGVPVLFADIEEHGPEVEALVPERNSWSFRASDSGALARSLREVMAARTDREERGRQGQQDMLARFSINHMVDAFRQAVTYVAESRGL